MIFMVKNTEHVCYDPEFDMWFTDHPYAPDYIFAPIKWLRQRVRPNNSDPQAP